MIQGGVAHLAVEAVEDDPVGGGGYVQLLKTQAGGTTRWALERKRLKKIEETQKMVHTCHSEIPRKSVNQRKKVDLQAV